MNDPANVILWGAVLPFAVICLALSILLIRTALRRKADTETTASFAPTETMSGKTWIVLAIAAIAIISVPAQRLISLAGGPLNADITVEVTGNMWFWTYTYLEPGLEPGNHSYSAPMLEDAMTGETRLEGLPESHAGETNRLVVPVGKTVRLVTKGESVIYRWSIPSLGVLVDALPGRPNETFFSASAEGRYYSDYDALCSPSHVFIPMEIEVVSEEQYNQWLSDRQIRVSAAEAGITIR
jgi:cytochrome c oxidase subunit 2